MPFSYIDVILVNLNLFKSRRAKTADIVSIYFTMRCRKWRIKEARPQAEQRLRVVKEDVGWLLSAGKSFIIIKCHYTIYSIICPFFPHESLKATSIIIITL